jgi:hypothetical protein
VLCVIFVVKTVTVIVETAICKYFPEQKFTVLSLFKSKFMLNILCSSKNKLIAQRQSVQGPILSRNLFFLSEFFRLWVIMQRMFVKYQCFRTTCQSHIYVSDVQEERMGQVSKNKAFLDT